MAKFIGNETSNIDKAVINTKENNPTNVLSKGWCSLSQRMIVAALRHVNIKLIYIYTATMKLMGHLKLKLVPENAKLRGDMTKNIDKTFLWRLIRSSDAANNITGADKHQLMSL